MAATPRPTQKLFLLDAMALIYRAHFAFSKNPRVTTAGMSTGAIFGFTTTLLEVINKEKPTHLAVAFDTHAPTFRHVQFDAYKANRQEQPEDIAIAGPYIKRILEAYQIPVLELDGFEADDIIGTIAWQAADAGMEVFMMTPDKDYGQLVRDHVYLYKPSYMGKGVDVMGTKEICERWGIERVSQVCDVLGLMGDAVDNVPGIPGIGEKTAVKLIAEWGTVENLLDHADEIKGKVGENLKTHREQGLLSKQLICIDTKVPVDFDPVAFALKEPLKEPLAQVFEELEFRTLAQRVLGEEARPKAQAAAPAKGRGTKAEHGGQLSLFGAETLVVEAKPAGPVPYPDGADELPFIDDGVESVATNQAAVEAVRYRSIDYATHSYHLIDTELQRKRLCRYLLEQKEFCFDTETDAIDVHTANLVGLSFSYRAGEAYFVLLADDREQALAALEDMRPAFEAEHIVKIGQNIKFDMVVLMHHGIQVKGPLWDTMLAHYLIEPEQRHGMDALAEQYLDYTPVPIEDLIGKKGKGQLTMRQVPTFELVEYACEDADITLQLKYKLEPELKRLGLEELFHEIECPLVPVLAEMEVQGIAVDFGALKELSTLLGEEAKVAEQKIYEDAGEVFNIGSPLQLGKILFEKLRLDDKARKTATGQYSTSEDVLSRLAVDHVIAADIIDYRQIVKLKNTYIDALPELVSPRDNRVHTSFNQAVAATGRLSSTNPNLQNIPIRTERGKEIRKAFVARGPGRVLVSADYSQIELRIMASFSGDETMIEAFRQNKDIHQITASKIYHIPLEQVTGDMRRKAKTANFGIIYGISSFGLAQRLGIPRVEASELIKEYFKEFPAVKAYMDKCILDAREQEYVTTLLGRRRYLRDINSRNQTMQSFAERNAINAPIQGTAADMIKIAMIRVHEWLEQSGLETKMILQVHDELVFDAPEHEVELIREPITRHMSQALLLKVPVEVGFGMGYNWLEAH